MNKSLPYSSKCSSRSVTEPQKQSREGSQGGLKASEVVYWIPGERNRLHKSTELCNGMLYPRRMPAGHAVCGDLQQ